MLMEEVILDKIKNINIKKLKRLGDKKLILLCNDIRAFLINNISKTGGHIGANLGTIEISVAIHKIFNSPKDKIIFDTGHQAYTHKILTGRLKKFKFLNKYKKGFSRFTDRKESKHDIIDVSHAATSISISSGLAFKKGFKNKVVAIIGDGSLVEGMAFEALNYVSDKKIPLLIVLIDNGYAIDKNVGGIKYMTSGKNWVSKSKNFFESIGLNYECEKNGHDVVKLYKKLKKLKNIKKTTIFHIKTIKGLGLEISKNHPYKMHFSMPFDVNSGKGAAPTLPGKSYASELANHMEKYLNKNKDLFIITPATPYSNNLQKLIKRFPKNVLDVGMAEQHAAGMAAGFALNKKNVVLCYQSTFMQRAFDQIFHDIAFMNLPVTILSSRSGFAGYDSATHHSLMDLSYLRAIPNIEIYYPSTVEDSCKILNSRLYGTNKNTKPLVLLHQYEPVNFEHKPQIKKSGYDFFSISSKKNLIITTGNYINRAMEIKSKLIKKNILVSILCLKYIKPIDKNISKIIKNYKNVVAIEENTIMGGIGSEVIKISNASKNKNKINIFGIKDIFINPGNSIECSKEAQIDIEYISKKLLKIFSV